MSMKKIPLLDGIRAISVIIVMLSHSGFGHVVPGGFGVTVFFFLSGFLITTLLINEFEKKKTINLRNFFVRRFLRLSPPLVFTLLIAYVLVAFDLIGGGVSWLGGVFQFFYMANYHQVFNLPGEVPEGTGILWSLAVEEHFYLFFPFLFLFLIVNTTRKSAALILIFITAVVLIWRCYLIYALEVNENRTYYSTDTRIDSILFGCIMALVINPVETTLKRKNTLKNILLFTTAALGILATFLYRDDIFRETFRYTFQGVLLIPIFYIAITNANSFPFRWLDYTTFQKIGFFSYSIYLIHHIVISLLLNNFDFDSNLLLFFLTFTVSLFYAWSLDRLLDVKFQSLRKRYK